VRLRPNPRPTTGRASITDWEPEAENGPGGPSFAPRLGDRLVTDGLITPQQLKQALETQQRQDAFLGQVLVDLGFLTAPVVGKLLARDFGVDYVDLLAIRPDPEVVALVPEHVIRETQAVPLRMVGDVVEVAMADPLDVSAIDQIYAYTKKQVRPCLTMAWELKRTINDLFDAYSRTSEALRELEKEEAVTGGGRRSRADLVVASEAPIVRLVESIVESAIAQRASDIHFEPYEAGLRVRFRVDGTLREQTDIPASQQPSVIARLKVLCTMDITESRRPQDGRMRIEQHGSTLDFRASSVPTVFGEKLVLRILDETSVMVPLARLGFLPAAQKRFESLIRQPLGMVIVVGPTGSGKSTTLYSALNLLNDATRNIMTLEDPVEYNVRGLNQVQVNARIGLTFASGLRSFVRQDPDIILVGEIRDRETAEMAVQASLTGHLMLSTLHTNSAVGTIARLANLGVDPFLIAQALSGVVSQRLVAKVCIHCARDYHPSREVLDAVGIAESDAAAIHFRKGDGCRTCHGQGYLGRVGIYEVLVVDEDMRKLIMRNAPESELQRLAERNGMQSLRQCALVAVQAGVTTPEEMGRVVLAQEPDVHTMLPPAPVLVG
jgi:type IV pilus assembly protein PilB